jgi:citrate lyase subunit beta/citryl-CoA lyase
MFIMMNHARLGVGLEGVALAERAYQHAREYAKTRVQGRAIGFEGKTLIHPSQLETCNRVFAPAPEDVARARAILAAFALPENKNKGAISLDGRMVERLHADMAKRTIAIADAISAMGN